MTFEEGLVTKLKAAAAVAAITTLVQPVKGQPASNSGEGNTPAQILYALVSRDDLEAINAPNPYREAVYDIACVAEVFGTVVALADAVEDALNFSATGYGTVEVLSASVQNVFDGTMDDSGLFARTVQVKFGYRR